MPFKSKAQQRLMFAAANSRPGKAKRLSVSRETARKFVRDSAGIDISKLPERVKK